MICYAVNGLLGVTYFDIDEWVKMRFKNLKNGVSDRGKEIEWMGKRVYQCINVYQCVLLS